MKTLGDVFAKAGRKIKAALKAPMERTETHSSRSTKHKVKKLKHRRACE